MAVTKIKAIRSRLDNCINYAVNPEKTEMKNVLGYIENPEKTGRSIYVTSFNCSRENAFNEMVETQKRFNSNKRKDSVLGYHIIMSYKPGEVTPEEAFEYGSEFIKRNLAQKYEVVMATHIDREHIHCHIVFNSVSFIDGKKYRCNFKDYFKDIRGLSDTICKEHDLSVIDNPQGRNISYAEWKAGKDGKPTIRGRMREELDMIISQSRSTGEFWRKLSQAGYVVHRRGPNISHTSIIPPFGKRPVRIDNLGSAYTEEAIKERITAARYGIRQTQPSQVKKKYRIKGNLNNRSAKKLKGFTALYFKYLYLFGKVKKYKTRQDVSFLLRDEIVKFERYQKQFLFLYAHGIETNEQLTDYTENQKKEIDDLTGQRAELYTERSESDEGKQKEITQRIADINNRLKECRSNVRLCEKIFADSARIKEKYAQAQTLQKQNIKEVRKHEHERGSR